MSKLEVKAPAQESKAPKSGQIVCRIRHKTIVGPRGPRKYAGEFELENLSDKPIDIHYLMSPLQYLDFEVIGPDDTVVSDLQFSDRFSPMRVEKTMHLEPGEKFTQDIPLLGTVPHEDRPSGDYTVQAVFEYNGIRAESNRLIVTV